MCVNCGNITCNNCNKCQSSILNNQSSIIPNPICTPDCLPVTGCIDTLPANCVIYYGPDLSCTGILTNDNISIALSKINNSICSLAPSGVNCNVYASCTDPCPSALVNKISSSTLNVTLSTNGVTNCQSVSIEERPWVATNLTPGTISTQVPTTFPSPLSLYSPALIPSTPRYAVRCGMPNSTNNACPTLLNNTGNYIWLEVKLEGHFTIFYGSTTSSVNMYVYSLPSQFAPQSVKFYPIVAYGVNGRIAFGSITITTTGLVLLNITAIDYIGLIFISLDGLNYIRN